MTSQAVSRRESQVPDLRPTPATQLTAEDIALPRVYLGQFMSRAVQDGLVRAGDVFSAVGQDDPDPQVLWSPWRDDGGSGKTHKWVWDTSKDGPVFYVLGLRKAKSFSEDGGELQLYDFDDPTAPEKAWTTYNYTITIPSVDDEIPFKFLLTKTGRPAAQIINMVLMKNSIGGPAWANAFELTTGERENQKGKYYVARVTPAEPDPKHADAIEALGVMVSQSAPVEHGSSGENPSI